MPIYEYACQECETHFEKLVQGSVSVSCPTCQGSRVNRLISMVGVRTQAGSAPAAAGGACCGGGCACH